MDLLQTTHELIKPRDVSWGNEIPTHFSITVQSVLLHPSLEGVVYWVLNKQETENTEQAHYLTPKPRGWGNPGGGVEFTDRVDLNGTAHSLEKTIENCGRRELKDETGFLNFKFQRYSPSQIHFLRNDYSYGHCVVTLLGRLLDFQSVPIKETEEIICGGWFDLSISPIKLFQNHSDLPYWSHVRRTINVFRYLARQTGNKKTINNIHPLWDIVFPIMTRNSRFPKNGYLIPHRDWYRVMRYFIQYPHHDTHLNAIYDYLKLDIDEKRKQESSAKFNVSGNLPYHEWIAEYEEDYRRWAEEKV